MGEGNALVNRWIFEAIDDEQLTRISHLQNAREIWEMMIKTNENTSSTRKFALTPKGSRMQLRSGEKPNAYNDRFRDNVMQLRGLDYIVEDEILWVWINQGLPKEYLHIITIIEEKAKRYMGRDPSHD